MARDPFDLEMSLLLDGLLDEESEAQLRRRLLADEEAADAWGRARQVDAVLRAAPAALPPVDFSAKVMAQVERYEVRRRWRPWVIGLMSALSLGVGLSVLLPVLFFVLGLQYYLFELPVIGAALRFAVEFIATAGWLLGAGMRALGNWLMFLSQEPGALALVISALVLASTWIGLREGQRAIRMAVTEAAAIHS